MPPHVVGNADCNRATRFCVRAAVTMDFSTVPTKSSDVGLHLRSRKSMDLRSSRLTLSAELSLSSISLASVLFPEPGKPESKNSVLNLLLVVFIFGLLIVRGTD